MADEISRRRIMAASTELPSGVKGSGVSTPSHFQIQHHLICVDGRRVDEDQWRLIFAIQIVHRKNGSDYQMRRRKMNPNNVFMRRLWEHDIPARRCGDNLVIAEPIILIHGVGGFCCLIESSFPLQAQDELWCDPKPDLWGDFNDTEAKIEKRVWIDRSSLSDPAS